MVVLDVHHVFHEFGGPKGVVTLLDRHQPGHGLSYNAVQMWRPRRQIPARWMAAVLYCIEREGRHCCEFFHDPDELA